MSDDAKLGLTKIDEAMTDASTKKPYEAPVLVRWGTLREVTMAVGSRGATDGAKKGPKNTSI